MWLVRSEDGEKVGKRVVIRFHYSPYFEVTSMLAVTHKFTLLCGTGILHLVDLPPTLNEERTRNGQFLFINDSQRVRHWPFPDRERDKRVVIFIMAA